MERRHECPGDRPAHQAAPEARCRQQGVAALLAQERWTVFCICLLSFLLFQKKRMLSWVPGVFLQCVCSRALPFTLRLGGSAVSPGPCPPPPTPVFYQLRLLLLAAPLHLVAAVSPVPLSPVLSFNFTSLRLTRAHCRRPLLANGEPTGSSWSSSSPCVPSPAGGLPSAPWEGWDLKESDTLTGGGRMREQLPFSHFRFHLRQEGTVSC